MGDGRSRPALFLSFDDIKNHPYEAAVDWIAYAENNPHSMHKVPLAILKSILAEGNNF